MTKSEEIKTKALEEIRDSADRTCGHVVAIRIAIDALEAAAKAQGEEEAASAPVECPGCNDECQKCRDKPTTTSVKELAAYESGFNDACGGRLGSAPVDSEAFADVTAHSHGMGQEECQSHHADMILKAKEEARRETIAMIAAERKASAPVEQAQCHVCGRDDFDDIGDHVRWHMNIVPCVDASAPVETLADDDWLIEYCAKAVYSTLEPETREDRFTYGITIAVVIKAIDAYRRQQRGGNRG